MKLSLYARLTKVDEATRTVSGVIASQTLDRSKEMFDYDSSKPHFEKWSDDFHKATEGKSRGNVRAMHGNIAAGRLTELSFDDAGKMITCSAEIIDDAEWNKVEKGLYTGFSIGGRYVRKWDDDDGVKRYEADPSEVSLVDLPCIRNATFKMAKADGTVDEVAFDESVTSGDAVEGDAEAAAEKLASEASAAGEVVVDGATKAADDTLTAKTDPEVGELRIEGANVQKWQDGAWQNLGVLVVDDATVMKDAYSIASLARLAEDVQSFIMYRTYETTTEGEVGNVPDSLKAAATALYDALLAIVADDVGDAKTIIATKVAEAGELAKRHTESQDEGELAKVCKALGVENADGLVAALAKIASDNEELRKRWEALPAATVGVLKVVGKGGDVAPITGDGSTATASVDASPEEVTKAAFKSALSTPMRGMIGVTP